MQPVVANDFSKPVAERVELPATPYAAFFDNQHRLAMQALRTRKGIRTKERRLISLFEYHLEDLARIVPAQSHLREEAFDAAWSSYEAVETVETRDHLRQTFDQLALLIEQRDPCETMKDIAFEYLAVMNGPAPLRGGRPKLLVDNAGDPS